MKAQKGNATKYEGLSKLTSTKNSLTPSVHSSKFANGQTLPKTRKRTGMLHNMQTPLESALENVAVPVFIKTG